MNLGAACDEIHLITGLPTFQRVPLDLPEDPEAKVTVASDASKAPFLLPSGMRAGTHPTRLGPFSQAAEAALLLGDALELVLSSSSSNVMDADKCNTLDGSLRALGMKLLKAAVGGWEECCAAIGLCFG